MTDSQSKTDKKEKTFSDGIGSESGKNNNDWIKENIFDHAVTNAIQRAGGD